MIGHVSINNQSENPQDNVRQLIELGETKYSEIKRDAILTSSGRSATLIKYKRTLFH